MGDGKLRAPFPERFQEARAQPVEADASNLQTRAGNDQACDQRKRRRGKVARHADLPAAQLRLAGEGDAAAAVRPILNPQVRAKVGKHPLAVVARRLRLDHRGLARRVEGGQQNGRFDLSRGDGKGVDDGQGIGGTADGQGKAASRAADKRGADLLQGIHDPPHGPGLQRRIAAEERDKGMGGHQPHQQPRSGAGIPHVENAIGFAEAADAPAKDAPAVAVAGDFGTETA